MWHRQSFYPSRDRRPLVNAYEKRFKNTHTLRNSFLQMNQLLPNNAAERHSQNGRVRNPG
jgi:hypothetical protein